MRLPGASGTGIRYSLPTQPDLRPVRSGAPHRCIAGARDFAFSMRNHAMHSFYRTASSIIVLALTSAAPTAHAQDAKWPPEKAKESDFNGRKLYTFQHGVRKEWGYADPQKDTFLVLHPKEAKAGAPLYVVLHSAG